MKKSECQIGKKVKLDEFLVNRTEFNRLGIGEIASEPRRANGTIYEASVRWSDGKISTHPLSRLKEVA